MGHEITLINQEDTTGCGIACVATVIGLPYQTVKTKAAQLFKWGQNRKIFRTGLGNLERLLKEFDVECVRKKSRKWEDISGLAIVGVNRQENGKFHWVVVINDERGFLILDTEDGEIYFGNEWAGKDDGYLHSVKHSFYIDLLQLADSPAPMASKKNPGCLAQNPNRPSSHA